jgi:hypothetical protein
MLRCRSPLACFSSGPPREEKEKAKVYNIGTLQYTDLEQSMSEEDRKKQPVVPLLLLYGYTVEALLVPSVRA